MDGLPPTLTGPARTRQRTLATAIGCIGVGLHTGARAQLMLRPAEAGTGITVLRTDLAARIPARYDLVSDTRLCTLLSDAADPALRVGTIEHVTAALAACGVDNAVIEVDGPEIPILDGSAAPFVFLVDCAGLREQDAPLRTIEVRRTVRVQEGEAFAELRPSAAGGLSVAVSIEFAAAAIGCQALSLSISDATFRAELAAARTFTMKSEVAALRSAGLAQGGTLANAVVVDGGDVLNPGGLRMPDEFVRHKALDVVGDLSLAGAPLCARFVAHRPGHGLNNRLLRALFADRSAWAWSDASALPEWNAMPVSAAALHL